MLITMVKVEADDAAAVLQKVLTGAKVAIEDVATNAFELLDADNDGQLTAKDAAYILQKALDSTFLMPNEKYNFLQTPISGVCFYIEKGSLKIISNICCIRKLSFAA